MNAAGPCVSSLVNPMAVLLSVQEVGKVIFTKYVIFLYFLQPEYCWNMFVML